MGTVGVAAACRQCRFIQPALGLPAWRREYEVSMDLYAQRRAWQHRGTARSGWRVRDRHRVARRCRGRDHGCAGQGASIGIQQAAGELRIGKLAAAE